MARHVIHIDGQGLDQRQTEACATPFAVGGEKGAEDAIGVGRRYPRAIINHPQSDLSRRRLDDQPRLALAVVQGVVDQVAHHRSEVVTVHGHANVVLTSCTDAGVGVGGDGADDAVGRAH